MFESILKRPMMANFEKQPKKAATPAPEEAAAGSAAGQSVAGTDGSTVFSRAWDW